MDDKKIAISFYIIAGGFFLAALTTLIFGHLIGLMYLGLGIGSLTLGSSYLKKSKTKADTVAEPEIETEENE